MKFLTLFAFAMITSSCCSQKIETTLGPFTGEQQPYAQSWTGGIPGSGSGINLFFPLDRSDNEYIEAVYYQGQIATDIEIFQEPESGIVARIGSDFNSNPDILMNLDPSKEYGNQVPEKKEAFPFDLADDEAVLKYVVEGKVTYIKVVGIAKRSQMELPSRPQ